MPLSNSNKLKPVKNRDPALVKRDRERYSPANFPTLGCHYGWEKLRPKQHRRKKDK